MRLLITGAGGFIGSVLCKHFESRGYTVLAHDNFSFGSRKALEGFSGKILEDDLRSLSESDLDGMDAVLHQGAVSDPTWPDERLIMETNYEATVRLLSHCVKKGIRCIYASSSAVYGNAPVPNVEFAGEMPLNAYARSKLMADQHARKLIAEGNGKIVGLRYFNIYGPGEDYKPKGKSIVSFFLSPMLRGQAPVVFGDGRQRRDLVYVRDVVHANELALEAQESCIVNVGSGKPVEYNRLVETINRQLGTTIAAAYQPNPIAGKYQFATQADLSLAAAKLGYSPAWSIEKGVREYAEYLRGKMG